MAPKERYVEQNLIDEATPRIRCIGALECQVSSKVLAGFLSKSPRVIGLSTAYSPKTSKLAAIAFAISLEVLIVVLGPRPKGAKSDDKEKARRARELIQQQILCRPEADGHLAAFDLGPIALSLYEECQLRVKNAIDVQRCCPVDGNRLPVASLKWAFEDTGIFADNVNSAFSELKYDPTVDAMDITRLALRAWAAHRICKLDCMEDPIGRCPKVDTEAISSEQMDVLSKLASQSRQLDRQKPTQTTQLAQLTVSMGKVRVVGEKFQDRFRANDNIRITMADGAYTTSTQVAGASGKAADAATDTVDHREGTFTAAVTRIGKDAPTRAESQTAATILNMLLGHDQLSENPWMLSIFTPADVVWPQEKPDSKPQPKPSVVSDSNRPMNSSQRNAVESMLDSSDSARISIVQGPPGTGKTTVIGTYVLSALAANQKGIWLTAQSNPAVKNIAEKLASIGFLRFKLLVSKDFHYEWHEHHYYNLKSHIIRSDNFGSKAIPEWIKDCDVFLCTLSMLSHPKIRSAGFTRQVPFSTLVVDEASQIKLADYIPIFTHFRTSLKKLCLIGDDKQLPPFGAEEVQTLQSIFEVPHLRDRIIFLDTQYRMPPQIGDFISKAFYDSKLNSNPEHPIQPPKPACFFVDIASGREGFSGPSCVNVSEQRAVMLIAGKLQDEEKKFRIITPYSAQTDAIQLLLQKEDLEWEDKCFNVDAFQGNEDDYIIISLVRSAELGFLKDLRRTNVMLTRARKGMYVCTSKAFLLKGKGRASLAGSMAEAYGDECWLDMATLEGKNY